MLEMLDRCVGDFGILDAIWKAGQVSAMGAEDFQVEDALWKALHLSLKAAGRLMFVIDGLDAIEGGQIASARFIARLHEIILEHSSVKAIVLTRPMGQFPSSKAQHFTLQVSHIKGDIRSAVKEMMSSTTKFDILTDNQRETILDTTATRANGSFLWAEMTLESLKKQKSAAAMMSALEKAPKLLTDTLELHLDKLHLDQFDTRSIFAWLLASERPLLVEEVKQLLDVDTKGAQLTPRIGGTENEAFSSMSPLVVVRDGVVSFRHPIVMGYVISIANSVRDYSNSMKFPFHLREAHYDLLARCLMYVKLRLYDEAEISMDVMDLEMRNQFFDRYILLEYTARYWISHFRASSLVGSDGDYKFTPAFKHSLPESVLLALLEGSCHESQYTGSRAVQQHRLSVEIRRLVLGGKSEAMLQSLILSARASQRAKATHANEHCYEAWRSSKEILGRSSPTTLATTELFVQATNAKYTKRTQVVSRREEVLKYLISLGQDTGAFGYSQTMKYVELLVQLYKDINETDSALAFSKGIYHATIAKYGLQSAETAAISDFMMRQFGTSAKDGVLIDMARTRHEYMIQNLDITDDRRIESTLAMVQLYEEQGDLKRAESLLQSLWQGLATHGTDTMFVFEKKMDVAFAYCMFLRRHSRNADAEKIIRTLWPEVEKRGVHSEGMRLRVEKFNGLMKDMELNDLSLCASLLIWNYYKETGQTSSAQATALATSLAETMHKSILLSAENTAAVPTRQRQLLRELIDSIMSSSSTISVEILAACHTLIALYMREENWTEAIATSSSVMKRMWPSVEDEDSNTRFDMDIAPRMVEIAIDLAYSYFRTLRIEKATAVYGNAFKASITTEKVVVPQLMITVNTIVEFYETTFQFPRAIALLNRVHSFLLSRLGESNKYTLDSLYLLAELATRIGKRDQAENSYRQIYLACLHGKTIHPNGFKAAGALCAMYEEDQKWNDSLDIYRHLWPTILNHGENHQFDNMLLEKTYESYLYVLQSTKADFSEIYQVASDYRMVCVRIYGTSHEKTLRATIRLAEICQANGGHDSEAIALYEGVLNENRLVTMDTATTLAEQSSLQTLLANVKRTLAQLYVRDSTTSLKALPLYLEELQTSRVQLGYASQTTVGWLREIVLLYSRQNSKDYDAKATELLRSFIFETLENETDTQRLQISARTIAQIYLDCGYLEAARSVIDELRYRIIYGSTASQKFAIDRVSAVFLIAFGEVITKDGSFSDVMGELMNEILLHESFSKSLFSPQDFVQTLASGARLQKFQKEKRQMQAAKETDSRLLDYFSNTLSSSRSPDKDVVGQFYSTCLKEIAHEDYQIRIINDTTRRVHNLCESSRFREAYDLSGLLQSFVHLTGGLHNVESIKTGIKLCLYLNGHETKKCPDRKLAETMSIQSKVLLQEIISASRTLGVRFSELPFDEINELVTLLGEQENFEELEVSAIPISIWTNNRLANNCASHQGILTDLWTSRIVQKTWSPNTVVWIGRRLVETRYCRGHTEASIQLCRSICYNLQQVWGQCDKTTLEMTKLLSGLYTAASDYRSAMALHETALYELLNDTETDTGRTDNVYHESNLNAADTAAQHIELLQRSYQRLGKWDKDPQLYTDLIARVSERFNLDQAQAQAATTQSGSTGTGRVDDVGVWRRPGSFSLDVDDRSRHQNHLRRTSGSGLLGGNGLRRTSIPAI